MRPPPAQRCPRPWGRLRRVDSGAGSIRRPRLSFRLLRLGQPAPSCANGWPASMPSGRASASSSRHRPRRARPREPVRRRLRPGKGCGVQRNQLPVLSGYDRRMQRERRRLSLLCAAARARAGRTRGTRVRSPIPGGCSSMVELQLPKLLTWVRFPSPAPSYGVTRQCAATQEVDCLETRVAVRISQRSRVV